MTNIFSEQVRISINSLQNAINRKQGSCYISGNLNNDDLTKIIRILQYEYPLLFKIYPNEHIFLHNNQISLHYNDLNERLFYEQLNELQIELEQRIPENANEYQIVKIIYDYITSSFEYDYDSFNHSLEFNNLLENNSNMSAALLEKTHKFNQLYGESHCIYGPVVNKKGVCSGLNQLFKFLLNQHNIEAQCVLGKLKNIGAHVVMAVKVNYEWAIIDIANGMKNVSPLNSTLYNYFMVSMEEIKNQFTPDYEEYNIINTVNHLNYYKKYNLEFNSINQLIAFFNNIILYEKDNVIYCKYIGNMLTDDKMIKLAKSIIYSKLNQKYIIGETIIIDKKLSIKIQPRKR